MGVHDDLREHFGDFESPAAAAEWKHVKASIALGQSVAGIVVKSYPFGVFVDIGVRFPALLLITRFEGSRNAPLSNPPLGSAIQARVCVYADCDRQIGLTQLERDPWFGE